MERLFIQLKTVFKDKISILSFLLPIIMALLLNFITESNISSATEIQFGIVDGEFSRKIEEKLENIGSLYRFKTDEDLYKKVNDPSDELIGILGDDESIDKIILSGDETTATKDYGNKLTEIINDDSEYELNIVEKTNVFKEFKNLLYSITIILAIFIGCTFNAMNIVSEKEDGVFNINEVIPMTDTDYIQQKISLGFITSIIVSTITILICMKDLSGVFLMIILMLFTSFITAMIGLLIGTISDNSIVAISYIKICMVLLLAVPIVVNLLPKDISFIWIFNILPSYPAFNGIMGILDSNYKMGIFNILILILYSLFLFGLYMVIRRKDK